MQMAGVANEWNSLFWHGLAASPVLSNPDPDLCSCVETGHLPDTLVDAWFARKDIR